jgi:hypothetical protein
MKLKQNQVVCIVIAIAVALAFWLFVCHSKTPLLKEGMDNSEPKTAESMPMANSSQSASAASALPKGIPKSEIPEGQEDMYILKSEVVPPVCPACPTNTSCPRPKPAPPCPPCGRCPEPAFECKKVPNYKSRNEEYLPKPFLNDFSKF